MNRRKWLITGISSGLGKSIAEAALENNDFVIGTFRKPEQVDAFNQQHKGKGKAYLLDLTDFEGITNLAKNIENEFESVDVLVNNAGVGMIGAIEEASMSEVKQLFEANVFGTLAMTQAFLPLMRKQHSGHIIQISSQAGVKATPGFGIYNSTKFAVEGFSEALADEVADMGIYVTIVEPGPFRTNFAGRSLKKANMHIESYDDTAGIFKNKLPSIHGKQEGDPERAAKAIIEMVNNRLHPLRLPLGKIALSNIKAKIESLTKDVEQHREIAESVVFDD